MAESTLGQTSQDGGPRRGIPRPLCCWKNQTTGTTSTGVIPGLFSWRASRPHLSPPAGKGRACRAVSAAPHPPAIGSRGSIKPQESGGEKLNRGTDPHCDSLQHGARDSVPPTPTPTFLGGRREASERLPKIKNLESNPRPSLKD